MKICIAGVGAVGGLLAAVMSTNPSISVSMIARHKKADALRTNGMFLHSDFYGELHCQPEAVVSSGQELEKMDAILVCVKNYSLDSIIDSIRPAVDENTVIIPVMNGIEPAGILKNAFPQNPVGQACIYTVSSLEPDFSVRQIGNYSYVYAGCRKAKDPRILQVLEEISKSRLDLRITDDVESQVWQKFILNCAFNTLTARYLTDSGHIRQNEQWKKDTYSLLSEAAEVGFQSGIDLPEDIVEQKFAFMMNAQSENATSSMRRDIEAGRPVEIDAFTGAVIRKADSLGIDVPVTRAYHEALLSIIEACH